MNASTIFGNATTPRLILDADRLERNASCMRAHCETLGVALRPHVKTSKSTDVALVASGGAPGPITVSTLAEAEHFSAAGWRDILYATAMVPAKLARADHIQRGSGTRLLIVADDADAITEIGREATRLDARFEFLIEVDCGEHRSGIEPASDNLVAIARAAEDYAPHLTLVGVMTHAGHSYALDDQAEIRALAEVERRAAVDSAEKLRACGYDCSIVSVGSTPTVLFAEQLAGVTEVRAGIYLFWDLAQLSRGICVPDDIAVSVLATVVGHQRRGTALVVDAGALALSKDVGAQRFMPDAGYGWICDATTLQSLAPLRVETVHQEHGSVPVPDEGWFERLPIGSLVRIIPNHACLTCAGYSSYDVLSGGTLSGHWPRASGW